LRQRYRLLGGINHSFQLGFQAHFLSTHHSVWYRMRLSLGPFTPNRHFQRIKGRPP
jgi:hypothetical protein